MRFCLLKYFRLVFLPRLVHLIYKCNESVLDVKIEKGLHLPCLSSYVWLIAVCQKTLRPKNITNLKQTYRNDPNLNYKHYTQMPLPRFLCVCSRGAGQEENESWLRAALRWTGGLIASNNKRHPGFLSDYMLTHSDSYSDKRYY